MKKTISISIIAAVLISLALTSVAFAQSEKLPKPRWFRPGLLGQIQSVNEGQLSVTKKDGEQVTIMVEESTRIFILGEGKGSFADLEIGRWIAGFVRVGEDQVASAKVIILLPENFSPEDLPGIRTFGRVVEVDTSNGSLTLEMRNEESKTIFVNEDTRFVGKIKTLQDIQEGMIVVAGASESEDGSLIGNVITVQNLLKRTAGTVATVNTSENSLSVNARNDKVVVFSVDENTKYNSRDNSVEGLSDLAPGMAVLVAVDTADENSPLAVSISATDKDQLPEFDLRVAGKVTEREEGSFVVETKEGETYQFLVDDDTKIHHAFGKLARFFRIKKGTNVIVGAEQLESGSYLAKVVLVRWINLPWRFDLKPAG